MPGTIVIATGNYSERLTFADEYPSQPERHVELITEKAIGYLDYKTYLQPIKRSEVEEKLKELQ